MKQRGVAATVLSGRTPHFREQPANPRACQQVVTRDTLRKRPLCVAESGASESHGHATASLRRTRTVNRAFRVPRFFGRDFKGTSRECYYLEPDSGTGIDAEP